MGKKKNAAMVLGYTRNGHEVLLPAPPSSESSDSSDSSDSPDMSEFAGWTHGDHLDAARILMEHGEREADPVGALCLQWSDIHRSIGKRAKKKLRRARDTRSQIRSGAETTILAGRRR
jgi:hypothetical protein